MEQALETVKILYNLSRQVSLPASDHEKLRELVANLIEYIESKKTLE